MFPSVNAAGMVWLLGESVTPAQPLLDVVMMTSLLASGCCAVCARRSCCRRV
jgi:hypothetical protein